MLTRRSFVNLIAATPVLGLLVSGMKPPNKPPATTATEQPDEPRPTALWVTTTYGHGGETLIVDGPWAIYEDGSRRKLSGLGAITWSEA